MPPVSRAEVEKQARTYLGMPYAHQGRGTRAIDCIGIALCVAEDLGLIDKEGNRFHRKMYSNYPRMPLGEELQKACIKHLVVKSLETPSNLNDILPGDVLTMRVPTLITHLAIVSDVNGDKGIIHSYNGVREKVIEHRIDIRWLRRIAGVFSFPGVID